MTVYLFGGLGNQLFQYFAGLAICEATGAQLRLKFVGRSSNSYNSEDIGLLAFQIKGQIVSSLIPLNVLEFGLRKFFNLVDKYGLEKLLRTFGFIMSKSIDAIYEQFRFARHIRLFGYFQELDSVCYLTEKKVFTIPKLKNPSNWFKTTSSELSNANPIVVHIRRGDYLNYKETLGVLDLSYFQLAIKEVPSYLQRNIWIFTDSLEVANELVFHLKLPDGQTRIVVPPHGSAHAESLVLMSRASAIVISNSTFSYWAAYFNSSAVDVIAPKKWFRGLNDPENFFPRRWRVFDSIWMQ